MRGTYGEGRGHIVAQSIGELVSGGRSGCIGISIELRCVVGDGGTWCVAA